MPDVLLAGLRHRRWRRKKGEGKGEWERSGKKRREEKEEEHMGNRKPLPLACYLRVSTSSPALSFRASRGRSTDHERTELKGEHMKEGSRAKCNFERIMGSKQREINVKFNPLFVD